MVSETLREIGEDANLPKLILVFDMDGNLLKKCRMKDYGSILGLSEDGDRLYVKSYRDEFFITRFYTKDIFN